MNQYTRRKELLNKDALSLRFIVKKMGLNQNALADALGVTKSAVSMGLNDSSSAHYRKEMREHIVDFILRIEHTKEAKLPKENNKRKLHAA